MTERDNTDRKTTSEGWRMTLSSIKDGEGENPHPNTVGRSERGSLVTRSSSDKPASAVIEQPTGETIE
jgi:hypothetical protein